MAPKSLLQPCLEERHILDKEQAMEAPDIAKLQHQAPNPFGNIEHLANSAAPEQVVHVEQPTDEISAPKLSMKE